MSVISTRRLALASAMLVLVLGLLLLSVAGPAGAAGRPINGGTTKITLEPLLAHVLNNWGYPIYLVAPSSWALTPDSLRLGYPVTGKTWGKATKRGRFTHKGGFFIVRYDAGSWHSMKFTDLTLNVDAAPDVTAVVNNLLRTSVFDADLSGATITYPTTGGKKWVKVTNVVLRVTAAGEAVFTGSFGVNLLPAGTQFGTAVVNAKFK